MKNETNNSTATKPEENKRNHERLKKIYIYIIGSTGLDQNLYGEIDNEKAL